MPSKKNRLKSRLGLYPRIYSSDFNGHITARELVEKIPVDVFKRYFKFAFVRNPWDWQVSLYHFAKQLETHHQHKIIRNMDFDAYIEWRVNEDLNLQIDFVSNENGEILVDFIGRLESLDEDFTHVCNVIQIKSQNKLDRLNASSHSGYRQYYNSTSKKLIEEAFMKDIETFGYSF